MKSFFRSARERGGGRLKRRAPSSSDESDSNDDESLLPMRKQKWRKRSSSVERNSECSSSGGKFAERHVKDPVKDRGDCAETRKACGGRLKKRAAPSSSDSSDDDDPLPPTQKRRNRRKRSSLVQQTRFRRSRRSLGDRKFASLEARQRYVKDRADSTRRQSKVILAESEATSRPGASSVELVAEEEFPLVLETPPRTRGSAVEDGTEDWKVFFSEEALTPSTSHPNPLHGRRCSYCHGPLVAIGTDRKNGKTHHPDWRGREYHKKCFLALLKKKKERNEYGIAGRHMRQVNSYSDTCPKCGNSMSLKTSHTQKNYERQFYACSCKATPGSGFRESFVRWLE